MHEKHENEQYFFEQATADAIADLLEPFERPCILCAPTVGVEMTERGTQPIVLDIDRRYRHLRSFRYWDIHRPEHIEDQFGVIFCDPPFFNVSLSRLFNAIRVLAQYDFAQPLAITYLTRRSEAFLGTFAPFNMRATAVPLSYLTVQACAKNDITLFANFEAANGTPPGSEDHI